jgi:hypothetical protein
MLEDLDLAQDTHALDAQLAQMEVELEQTMRETRHRDALANVKPLPTQEKYFTVLDREAVTVIIVTAANQTGKSFTAGMDVIAEAKGYEPWSGRIRPWTPYPIALLLRDYDNHASKFLEVNIKPLLPRDEYKIVKTPTGSPRQIIIQRDDGKPDKIVHVFTHDQDPARLEGGTYQKVIVDEPAPRRHVQALERGLQKTGGVLSMFMTPLSEPWIYDELYSQAGNLGGPKAHVYAMTAFPDENLISNGGYLDDERVAQFREGLSDEEKEARIHGRWMHLIGRVYGEFDEKYHVIADDFDPVNPRDCPWFCSVDPHTRRPWFIAWGYILPNGTRVFDEEFPKEPFEKLKDSKYTVDDYVNLFKRRATTYRVIDPNFSKTPNTVTGRTLTEELAMRGAKAGISLAFNDSVINNLAEGHLAVKDLLKFDVDNIEINPPRLLVKERCKNIIRAFNLYTWDNWSGKTAESRDIKPTPQEKYKDPMDAVRYACMMPMRYFSVSARATAENEQEPNDYYWEEQSPFRTSLSIGQRQGYGQ